MHFFLTMKHTATTIFSNALARSSALRAILYSCHPSFFKFSMNSSFTNGSSSDSLYLSKYIRTMINLLSTSVLQRIATMNGSYSCGIETIRETRGTLRDQENLSRGLKCTVLFN